MRDDQKHFIKLLTSLSHKHSVWDVWSDWLIMASSSIYNAIHRDPQVEESYLKTAERYSTQEQGTCAQLLATFVEGMERDPDRDFLGEVMGELSLHNTARGQFFTPMSVAHLCAGMSCPTTPDPGRIYKISEPSCGSGNMVIAYWTMIRQRDLPQSQFHFVCQDIDDRAFRMCYLQLSVLGLSAEVCLGDTLRGTTDKVWRTPGWYLHQMEERLRIDSMMRLVGSNPSQPSADHPEEEQAPELTPEPAITIPAPAPQFAEQLTFF